MRKRLLSSLLALCMVLSLLPMSVFADYTVTSGTIQGEVVSTTDQTPIAATVTLYKRSDTDTALETVTADPDGVFTIPLGTWFTAGDYTLVFSHSLYLSRSMDITVSSNDGLAISGSIGLYPAGRASGTVMDATTGTALSGVTVNVYTTSGELKTSTSTNSEGKYSLETEKGLYNFEFVLEGYVTQKIENISLDAIGPVAGSPIYEVKMTPGIDNGEDPGISGNITWSFRDGILTISGNGPMKDYTYTNPAPWYSLRDDIQEVVITEGVTSIGVGAFDSYWNMKSVTIPSSVLSINESAFYLCDSLESIVIPNGVIRIEGWAFYACHSLQSIFIPDSVISVGRDAFWACESLENVTGLNGVMSIDDGAFGGCSSLKSITIPDNMTNIQPYVFDGCSSLKSITIPNSIVSIGESAFNECSSLTDVYYSGSKEDWAIISIDNNNNDLTSATIHYSSTESEENTPTGGITFQIESTTIAVDDEVIITALISHGGNLQQSDISWKSSNEAIVSVTPIGVLPGSTTASATATIKGIARGTATITVSTTGGATKS